MARRSAHEHLKPHIEAEFKEGKLPNEVLKKFPEVGRGTVYRWFTEFGQKNGQAVQKSDDDVQTIETSKVEVLSPAANLISIAGAERISDFTLARRTLRGVANDRSQPGAVRVQASIGLMRLIQLRAELPKNVLEEIEETRLEDETSRTRQLSTEEIARRIREEVG